MKETTGTWNSNPPEPLTKERLEELIQSCIDSLDEQEKKERMMRDYWMSLIRYQCEYRIYNIIQ